jgi:hypothetical protein
MNAMSNSHIIARPLALWLFVALVGCGSATTPPPTVTATAPSAATAQPTTQEIINTPILRRAPTLAPTAPPTETPTATTAPTNTVAPTDTPAPTAAELPPTATHVAASPTRALAPAVYVTDLKITPPQPKNKPAEFFFTVSFLNTVGENVNYPRWRVLIYPKGEDKAIGDPEGVSKTIANGSSTQDTKPWSIKVGVVCESFVAQPVWEDENGKQIALTQPDGKALTLEFQVCP